jgi:hypothetical protein
LARRCLEREIWFGVSELLVIGEQIKDALRYLFSWRVAQT